MLISYVLLYCSLHCNGTPLPRDMQQQQPQHSVMHALTHARYRRIASINYLIGPSHSIAVKQTARRYTLWRHVWGRGSMNTGCGVRGRWPADISQHGRRIREGRSVQSISTRYYTYLDNISFITVHRKTNLHYHSIGLVWSDLAWLGFVGPTWPG